MFTGLIEELGRVTRARPEAGGREIEVESSRLAVDLAIGDSICVNGACQTVTRVEGARFHFYAMGETLRATTLGDLKPGDPVNLERALRADARLGGHFVSGHVDGTGCIDAIDREAGWVRVRLSMPPELGRQLVPKGSLAVDGISLTVGPDPGAEGCELFIIPHTLTATTLGAAKVGDRINLETDLLGKYVQAHLQKTQSGDARLAQLLVEHGFMKGGEE